MTELTATVVTALSTPQVLQISPDGRYIAYTLVSTSKKEEYATSAIWIASTDGTQPPRQFTRGDVVDSQPRWSPDGTQIAFLSDRAKRGTAQLYLIAVNGGEARLLTAKENKKPVVNFAWSPGGGQIAFTSADEPTEEETRREKERDDAQVYGTRWSYARLRLLSLATQEVKTLVDGNYHVANFVWHPRGTELLYTVTKTPELESFASEIGIERIDLAGGEPHLVCHFPNGIGSLTWTQDGQRLLFIGSVSGKGQSSQAIFAVPVQGGEPERIAGGETNCADDICDLGRGQSVAVSLREGLGTQIYRINPETGSLTPLSPTTEQEQAAEYRNWHARTVEGEKTVLAVIRGTGQQPWEVWAGSGEGAEAVSELHQISSHQEELAGVTFASQEPFFWSASDGLALDGLLLRPPDAPKDRPLPTIVLVHGGPYARWSQGFQLSWGNWAQWLALAGYAVLMPNPRGGMGHGEPFAAAALGDVGGADYADVMAAVDAAIERGIADPDRLGIGGWSQGGFMTAWAVTQTDRFKAGIMGAGVSDWGMMSMTSDVPDFESELGGSVPWEGAGPHLHAKLSPISFAHQVKTPVLILHGEKDARVPLSQAIGFHRALRKYEVPNEFVVYPREPHGIGERAHQIDLLQRVRTWFDRWLRV